MRAKRINIFFICFCIIWVSGSVAFSVEEEMALPTEWHKYYEPIENPGVMLYLDKCFEEAKRLFGKPVVPVREVHLRRSVKRKNIQLLSRAEIYNWQKLARTIMSRKDEPAYNHVWSMFNISAHQALEKLAQRKEIEYIDRLRILSGFNRMIEADNFYNERLFSRIVPKRSGFSLRKLFSSKETRSQETNRKVIAKLFDGNISEAPRAKRIAEGIELCECTDRYKGIFTIYVPSAPGEDEFYLEVAHEAAHLLNADYFDWYVEGLNNVFAEYMADSTGHSFKPWARLFARGRNSEPYAISYFMMKAVVNAAGAHMSDFLEHGVPWSRHDSKMRININPWLAKLPDDVRLKVIDAINHYGPLLEKNKGSNNAFYLP